MEACSKLDDSVALPLAETSTLTFTCGTRSCRIVALKSTQPQTNVYQESSWKYQRGWGLRLNDFTAIYVAIVLQMWEPRRLKDLSGLHGLLQD
jgi:hypothetical protein